MNLNKSISESQTGFMKSRSIHNNIHLVLDLLDYNHFIEDDGCILFSPSLPQLLIGGCSFNQLKYPNKKLRNILISCALLLNTEILSYNSFQRKLLACYEQSTCFSLSLRKPELHVKTLNGIYPSSALLRH